MAWTHWWTGHKTKSLLQARARSEQSNGTIMIEMMVTPRTDGRKKTLQSVTWLGLSWKVIQRHFILYFIQDYGGLSTNYTEGLVSATQATFCVLWLTLCCLYSIDHSPILLSDFLTSLMFMLLYGAGLPTGSLKCHTFPNGALYACVCGSCPSCRGLWLGDKSLLKTAVIVVYDGAVSLRPFSVSTFLFFGDFPGSKKRSKLLRCQLFTVW